jgi:nucleolar protein 6
MSLSDSPEKVHKPKSEKKRKRDAAQSADHESTKKIKKHKSKSDSLSSKRESDTTAVVEPSAAEPRVKKSKDKSGKSKDKSSKSKTREKPAEEADEPQDELNEPNPTADQKLSSKKSKSSKKDKSDKNAAADEQKSASQKKKKQAKSDTDENAADTESPKLQKDDSLKSGASANKSAKKDADSQPSERKVRFVAFMGKLNHATREMLNSTGNLPFTTTEEHIAAHLETVQPTSIRLMRKKDSNESRGFAFVEFDRYDHMKTCLQLYHHSSLADGISPPRRINIELT